MKSKWILLLPIIPIAFFVVGYFLREYGLGFFMLVGVSTFCLSLYAVAAFQMSEKCPNCGNVLLFSRVKDRRESYRCFKCGCIIKK